MNTRIVIVVPNYASLIIFIKGLTALLFNLHLKEVTALLHVAIKP